VYAIRVDDDLELRLPLPQQSDEVFALVDANRAHLRAWLPWVDATRSAEDTRANARSCLETLLAGTAYEATIVERGVARGRAGLRVDPADRRGEIGYWVAADAQGRGLVTRSVRALTLAGFDVLGLNKVEIHCAPDNVRSRAVAQRLGFVEEGTVRQAEWLSDHYVDHVVYGLLASERADRLR
jgi:ribosomal-protein-serine acetyltransferase